MRILVLSLALLILLPVSVEANTPAVGMYQIVVCGEGKQCEPVSADFDYKGELRELSGWIDTFDREYHADDLFLLRRLPVRQVGEFEESHMYQKRLIKYLEFENDPQYYITATDDLPKAVYGFLITDAELERISAYLDWYMAYYEQTDGLRETMLKIYLIAGLVLLFSGGLYGAIQYRKKQYA